jgi:hypothetical protein
LCLIGLFLLFRVIGCMILLYKTEYYSTWSGATLWLWRKTTLERVKEILSNVRRLQLYGLVYIQESIHHIPVHLYYLVE